MLTFKKVALVVLGVTSLVGCATSANKSQAIQDETNSAVITKSHDVLFSDILSENQEIALERVSENSIKASFPGITTFNFDGKDISADKKRLLQVLSNALLQVEYKGVQTIGHTDSRGNAQYNLQLSKERAKIVADYLVMFGINAEKVSSDGVGSKEPIADNSREAGRAQNRRVDIFINF